jgi:hypothetical protein
VQDTYDASGAMIEPIVDIGGANGHVCFRVVPTILDDGDTQQIDMAVQARRVATILRNRILPSDLQPALRTAQ